MSFTEMSKKFETDSDFQSEIDDGKRRMNNIARCIDL